MIQPRDLPGPTTLQADIIRSAVMPDSISEPNRTFRLVLKAFELRDEQWRASIAQQAAQKADWTEPHPPSRLCMCPSCIPSFDDRFKPQQTAQAPCGTVTAYEDSTGQHYQFTPSAEWAGARRFDVFEAPQPFDRARETSRRQSAVELLLSIGYVWNDGKWQVQHTEPFGYFRSEPFGWTNCAETDDGAIALYEAPPAHAQQPSDEVIELAEAMQVRRILEEIKAVSKLHQAADMPRPFTSAWQSCCEEIFYRATGCQWHMNEDESKFERAANDSSIQSGCQVQAQQAAGVPEDVRLVFPSDQQIIAAMTEDFPTPSLVPMLRGNVICGDFHKALVAAVTVGINKFCALNGLDAAMSAQQAQGGE